MQPELRLSLEGAAAESGRSLNAEIVARLEQSFSSNSELFSPRQRDQIERYADQHSVEFPDALRNLVTAGLNPTAPLVITLPITDGTEVGKLIAALDAIQERVPKKTVVEVEHSSKRTPTKVRT